MNLPNLIIGGAPKCGTSSLYFWLAAHPEVFASKTKEPFYYDDKITHFNKQCNYINHDLKCYSNYFKHVKRKVFVSIWAREKNILHVIQGGP